MSTVDQEIDVLTIGETVIDFISAEPSDNLLDAATFNRYLGGSPANIAVNTSKLGGDAAAYREFLGIPDFYTPEGFNAFESTRFMPTLEFNGIGGGYQGAGSKTVIPSRAFVKISCRLVANQDPVKIRQQLYAAIRDRMPRDVNHRIIDDHDGTPYVVVPPDRPNTPDDQSPVLASAFRATDEAVADVFGNRPLYLREGGSVPIIADIRRVVGLDSVLLGLFLPEDNLHAPDESFDLEVMERGMEVSKRVLRKLAGR